MVVTVRNLPGAYITPTSQSVCLGNSVTLSSYGYPNPLLFIWYPGGNTSTSISVSPTINTTYTVVVTDSVGCTASQTAAVTLVSPNLSTHNVSCNSIQNN